MGMTLETGGITHKLQARYNDARRNGSASVVVGYTAPYALFVHESIEMKLKGLPRRRGHGRYWDPQGRAQAKFLEQPARTSKPQMAGIVRRMMLQGGILVQALVSAGLFLQRASQRLVPVDTGNLKNSAFTRIEDK